MHTLAKPLQAVVGTQFVWLRFTGLEGFRKPAGNQPA
jgi:hypothetical protein